MKRAGQVWGRQSWDRRKWDLVAGFILKLGGSYSNAVILCLLTHERNKRNVKMLQENRKVAGSHRNGNAGVMQCMWTSGSL